MNKMFNIAFVVMYSEKFAMTGETHGVSVLAGVVKKEFHLEDNNILILDLYGQGVKDKTSYICDNLKIFMPDIVGFSCPYGSYSTLLNTYETIKNNIPSHAMIMFGGALPTYIPRKYLDIDPKGYVIVGEGEEAIVGLINCYLRKDYSLITNVPNLCFLLNSAYYSTSRKLVDLKKVALPYRNHLGISLDINSQIYVEHSRGCSWSNCSFCSRNLLSLEGCSEKYRVFHNDRLLQDLMLLKQKGVKAVTFADEDFAGNGICEREKLLNIFKTVNSSGASIMFDASMNVNSVYSEKWDARTINQNTALLKQLKQFGLRKVFLGVESGSSSQLKRYRKQQTVNEAINAIRILEECNIDVEIGYIIFDPLCTMNEVRDDLLFLYNNNFAKYVSSLGSGLDLRLHMDTPYVRMLIEFEKENGITLHSLEYDIDTLNYTSNYLFENVAKMAKYVQKINEIIRPIYYPLKSISRYGLNGSLKGDVSTIKNIVIEIRNKYLMYLLQLADCIDDETSSIKVVEQINLFIKSLLEDKKTVIMDIRNRTGNIVLDELIKNYY